MNLCCSGARVTESVIGARRELSLLNELRVNYTL
jgi:hypothetical protein